MGVLAPRLRTLDGPLVPPSTWAEIFRHTCLQSHLQTSPPSDIWSFGTLGQISKISKKKLKNLKIAPRGPGGGVRILFVFHNFLYFFLGAHGFFSSFFSSKFFKKSLKKPKNRPRGGQGVGVRILFFSHIFYYFFLGAHAKIWNPTTTPSVVLNSGGNKSGRKKKKNFR